MPLECVLHQLLVIHGDSKRKTDKKPTQFSADLYVQKIFKLNTHKSNLNHKGRKSGTLSKISIFSQFIDLTHSQRKEEWKSFKMCLVDFQKNYFEFPPQISPKGIYDFLPGQFC